MASDPEEGMILSFLRQSLSLLFTFQKGAMEKKSRNNEAVDLQAERERRKAKGDK